MSRPSQPSALTNRSGKIVKGGVSQPVFAFDGSMLGFMLQNVDRQAPLFFSLTGVAGQAPGSFVLPPVQPGAFPGQSLFILPATFKGVGTLSVAAADTGHAFSCLSW